MRKIIYFFAIFFVLLLFAGKLLDQEAERTSYQVYVHDKDDIIEGCNDVVIANNKDTALLVLHGFQDAPDFMTEFSVSLSKKIESDLYIPLLPFHGRTLKTKLKLENDKVTSFVKNKIMNLSQKYKQVYVLGYSYSGAIMIEILSMGDLPKNVEVILYAPGVYVEANNFFKNVQLTLYSFWRNYNNYKALGAIFPFRDLDPDTDKATTSQKSLQYYVVPALKEAWRLDTQNRRKFGEIKIPHFVVMSDDDNRVSYNEIKQNCLKNKKYCTFKTVNGGRHYTHVSRHRKELEDLIVKLLNKN